jgi:formate dehydrogenase subunit delta
LSSGDQGRLTTAEAKYGAGPGTGAGHGTAEHLVKMANDIGNFFRSEPNHADAVAGIANHIAKYWTARMRQKLARHIEEHGDSELDELPREAIKSLPPLAPAAPKPKEPPGGDAG